ncbi:hypothetical protein [Bacillus sp. FJAT-42376]|uniref:GT-D fold domain-containing protein n=1 Tax=Bacillus sp. FJAT-42376 TaxID=2014076 RepID=UPI000F4E40CF|nr:hypothetical protein [Bacillus sp. FJAT-42376]
MNLTHSNVNLELNELGLYTEIFKNYKVLLIGNRMEEVKEHVENMLKTALEYTHDQNSRLFVKGISLLK